MEAYEIRSTLRLEGIVLHMAYKDNQFGVPRRTYPISPSTPTPKTHLSQNHPPPSTATMRTISLAVITITLCQSVLAQKGFHLMDRHIQWVFKAEAECPSNRISCAEIREPFDDDGLWLVPANQFNCDVIRDKVSSPLPQPTKQCLTSPPFRTTLKAPASPPKSAPAPPSRASAARPR